MSERKVRIERATNGELMDLLLELDEAGKSPIFPGNPFSDQALSLLASHERLYSPLTLRCYL